MPRRVISVSNVTRNTDIKTKLKCLNTNAQSLQYKLDELEDIITNYDVQVATITETWGKEWKEQVLELEGFNRYKKNRVGERQGGGCSIYVSKKVNSYECIELKNLPGDDAVWCWIKLENDTKILIGCIYRSTSSNPRNNELIMNQIIQASELAGNNRILLMGDFNLKDINWIENDVVGGPESLPFLFYECVNDCFLHQHVVESTRFRGEQNSLLDLIFTKEENDVKNIEVLNPLATSDHGVVVCDVVCEWRENSVFIPKRVYHKGNYELMNHLIQEVNWEMEFEGLNIHQKWAVFKSKLEEIANQCIPMSEPKRYKTPWMNRKVTAAYKKKYHAWKRYLEHKRSIRWREYVRKRNIASRIARNEKKAFEKKLTKEIGKNRRGFFKYVNSKLTVKPEISALRNVNGEIIHEEKEMSNICNTYFHSAFTRPTLEELPEMESLCDENIQPIVVTPEIVRTKLEKLNKFKGSGPDNIHPHVLSETAATICNPLSMIFNESLEVGETPEDWRNANVTPIFKKGDRNDPANYRPVSLTSQVCKVLESIVRENIFSHLKSYNLLSDEQHGFREGRSCLSNLLTTLEDWTSILEDGDCVDVAYLDFRKAFDLVSHKHLLLKLQKHGINGQICNWIKAFLENRKQRVVIRGCKSEKLDVLSGVPQGSVLGPILFLIFINDLPNCTNCPVCLFADDSKIYCRIPRKNKTKTDVDGTHEMLQQDLHELEEWARKWKMSFNVNKCKIMHLGYGNEKQNYELNGTVLAETTEEKDLGVLIDNDLKFSRHIKGVVAKANRMIGLIKISFQCIDDEMFLNLYNTLIRPLLEYCVQAWSPYLKKDIILLENVQRRATKLVGRLRNKGYEERLKELKLTKLQDRRSRGDMILTYRLLNGLEGTDYSKFFTFYNNHYNLRGHSMKLEVTLEHLNIRKNFFAKRVVEKWNSLTEFEVSAPSTATFKVRYDIMENVRHRLNQTGIYTRR